jgi:hypothetical protein
MAPPVDEPKGRMPRMRTSIFVRSCLLSSALLVTLSGLAQAVPARLSVKAREYAAAHNLPVRTVAINLEGRQTERLFVPVLPATRADFEARFSAPNGAILWHQSQDVRYAQLQLDPATRIFREPGALNQTYTVVRTRELAFANYPENYFAPNGQPTAGHLVSLALDAREIQGLNAFFDANPHQEAWRANHPGGEIGREHCMWWLMHVEVGNNVPLAHALGVTRSRAPENLFKKILHAGNERVGPIGVPVNTIEEFNAMTDEHLMGSPPAGGVADAIKQ